MALETLDSTTAVQAYVRSIGEASVAPTSTAPKPQEDDPLWYKDAVIYQVHVKSFFDGNNDGIGDFVGLIEKLDYIASLGVTCVWLLPFYPSPRRDDGYDIADYRGIHADYGVMADARRFIAEAHRRNLKVITELIVNHTSDQHPWFQRARAAKPGSSHRNFYVWSDNDQTYKGTRIIFCDTEKSNWTWDPIAQSYFWHRFYSHQPDLNFDNPQVLRAVMGVMRYWLDMGVDGLRLDAVPYLIEREGTSNENLAETHVILKAMRAEIDRAYKNRLLLAEANMWPEDVQQYFGGNKEGLGDECHMAFHFPLMPRMYMALAQEDRFPMTDILRQTPDIPANCQWAVFLRNHDELTLEMVTDKERDYLWNFYASERRARINLGIRRRLAPLLERDRRRIELLNSLLLSMPGTPVIYYGDEIGMGDNIHLGDRDGVRTPMQWSLDRNGGFSRADPARLVLPPIMDPLYGFMAVNVEAQQADPHSLLNWQRRMLAIRAQHKAFGRGYLRLLYPKNRKVFAYLRELKADDGSGQVVETILCVANVSRASQAVEIDLSAHAGNVPVEMVGGAAFPPIGQPSYVLTLPPYGFYWFVLTATAQMPAGYAAPPEPMPDFVTLVIRSGATELLEGAARKTLEEDSLPLYLGKRRWYQAKGQVAAQVRIASGLVIEAQPLPFMLTEVEVRLEGGEVQRYALPLGAALEDEPLPALAQQLGIARVRRNRRVGLLTDAFALPGFVYRMLDLLREAAVLPIAPAQGGGELRFIPSSRMATVDYRTDPEVRWLSAEQSNSSVVAGNTAIFKLIRRIQPGIHPEAEMTRYLTEAGFANIAPMLGEITRIDAQGTPCVIAVVQAFLHNQGDAWEWTLAQLARVVQDLAMTPVDGAAEERATDVSEAMAQFEHSAGTLGRRLGQMHAALAAPTDDAAFTPEVADEATVAAWAKGALAQLAQAFELLARLAPTLGAERERAAGLLARRPALEAAVREFAAHGVGSLVTRVHGDLHLGQVLVSQGDAYFIDFEGEPLKPLDQRRHKASPWRDVAGMVRSFAYAAAVAAHQGPEALSEEMLARKQGLLDLFLPASRAAFLRGYREAANLAHQWRHADGEDALLALFTLEKAAYELCYEATNRPDWIGVPLRGLAAIADQLNSGVAPHAG